MQFFDNIKTDTSGAPQALRSLFGVPTLAFAINTTGSMDDVIDAVRIQAICIAKSLAGTDNEPELSHWALRSAQISWHGRFGGGSTKTDF
jgi:hypothetical protein